MLLAAWADVRTVGRMHNSDPQPFDHEMVEAAFEEMLEAQREVAERKPRVPMWQFGVVIAILAATPLVIRLFLGV